MDRVFYALSDSTRRDVLSRVSRGPVSITTLAANYEMSLPAIMKHIGVLESCGLLKTDKVGRVRSCELGPEPLKMASEWIEDYRQFWDAQLNRLSNYLDNLEESDQ